MENRDSDLLTRIAAQDEWYHTLELAPGVVTPGWFDTRAVADKVLMPASLAGKRCLDIGTFDGFWAFEMERRGADEVVAIDILDPTKWDWPPGADPKIIDDLSERKDRGTGFQIAAEALNSKVVRHELSVYDLDPATIGTFDFVYMGSLLIHLRDPVLALGRARQVCTGRFLSVDAFDLWLTVTSPRRPTAYLDGLGRPWWWKANLPALVRMIKVAGFRLLQPPSRLFMPAGPGHPPAPPLSKLRRRAPREYYLRAKKGDPHAAILCEPAEATAVAD
jgi:tRNA (mo5U34)-methyltransferase